MQRGRGFLDAFKKVGKAIGKAAAGVNSLARQTQIVSKVAGLIPHPYAQTAGTVAGLAGYGRRRRPRRRVQRGAGPLSSVLGMFGLGKRRRRRRV